MFAGKMDPSLGLSNHRGQGSDLTRFEKRVCPAGPGLLDPAKGGRALQILAQGGVNLLDGLEPEPDAFGFWHRCDAARETILQVGE